MVLLRMRVQCPAPDVLELKYAYLGETGSSQLQNGLPRGDWVLKHTEQAVKVALQFHMLPETVPGPYKTSATQIAPRRAVNFSYCRQSVESPGVGSVLLPRPHAHCSGLSQYA